MNFVRPRERYVDYGKKNRKFNYLINLDHVETIKPLREKDGDVEMYLLAFFSVSGNRHQWHYKHLDDLNAAYDKIEEYIIKIKNAGTVQS